MVMYDWRILSTSASVMDANRRSGQYSQIWDSQRMRLLRAVSRSSGVTNWLKLAFCAVTSSSSFSRMASSRSATRWSSSQIRLRMVPSLSTAPPSSGGSDDATSRRIREASLQPFPEVVMPIWSGPSVCVERRVKVQRFGASATLTGIRSLRHSVDICVPGTSVNRSDIPQPCVLHTQCILPTQGDKYCIHDPVNLLSP